MTALRHPSGALVPVGVPGPAVLLRSSEDPRHPDPGDGDVGQPETVAGDGLICQAIVALDALEAALERLIDEHCDEGVAGCDVCADADGLRYVLGHGISALAGEVLPPDGWDALDDRCEEARAGCADVPPGLAVVLALFDGLDALLDLAYGHCPSQDCLVCTDADGLIHHVRAVIERITGGLPCSVAAVERALQRELVTEERKVTRPAAGGAPRPHAARERQGAPEKIVGHLRVLARLRARRAK